VHAETLGARDSISSNSDHPCPANGRRRGREGRGQHPDRDPIREALIVRRLDLTNPWRQPTPQVATPSYFDLKKS
jgi:hypothetical protein